MSQDYFEYIHEEADDANVKAFNTFRSRFRRTEVQQETIVILDTRHLKPIFEDSVVAGYDLETADFHVVHTHGGRARNRGELPMMLANPRVRFLLDRDRPQLVATTEERWVDLLAPHAAIRQLCHPLTDPDGNIYAPSTGYVRYFRTPSCTYLYGGEHVVTVNGKKQTRRTLIACFPQRNEKDMHIPVWPIGGVRAGYALAEVKKSGDHIGYSKQPDVVSVAGIDNNGPAFKLTSEFGIDMTKDNMDFVRSIESVLFRDKGVSLGGHIGCMISELTGQVDEIDYARVKIGSQTVLMTGINKIDFAIPVSDALSGDFGQLSEIGSGRPFVMVNKKAQIPGSPGKYLMSPIGRSKDPKTMSDHSWGDTHVTGLLGSSAKSVDSLSVFKQKVADGQFKPTYPGKLVDPITLEVAVQRVNDRKNDKQRAEKDGLAMFSALTNGFVNS